MENTSNKPVISWNEYPVTGLFVTLMLTIIGISDGFYMMIPAALFFLLTGAKRNVEALSFFAKRYWYILIIAAVYATYFCIVNRSESANGFVIAATSALTGGFFVAVRCEGYIRTIWYKCWTFLLALIVLGTVKHFAIHQPGYFLSNKADLFATVLFAAITLLYIDQVTIKVAGVILALISAVVIFREGSIDIIRMEEMRGSVLYLSVLYTVIFICAAWVIIKNQNIELKKQAILVCVATLMSILLSQNDSLNVSYLVFLTIGMFCGLLVQTNPVVSQSDGTKIISRSDYLYMGLALAVLLSAGNEYRDGTWQLILTGVFFLLSEVRENCRSLLDFVKRYPLYAVFTLIWMLYFSLAHRPDMTSYRYPVVVFGILFSAYCISREGEPFITEAFQKLWVVLLTSLVICDVHHVVEKLSPARLKLFFLNPNIEGYAIIAFLLSSLLFFNQRIIQATAIILAVVSVVWTGSRGCTLTVAAIVVFFAVANLKRVTGLSGEQKKRIYIISGVAVLCVLLAGSILLKQEEGALVRLQTRYLQAISDIRNLAEGAQAVDYSSGNNARMFDIKVALETVPDGSAVDVIVGRGMLQQYYHVIRPIVSRIYSYTSDTVGPAENTFLSMLYDYGVASFIMLFGTFISAMIAMFRSQNPVTRKLSAMLVCFMLLNMTVDMEYWINIMFVVWIFIGTYLGVMEDTEKRHILVPCMVFCVFLVCMIFLLPAAYTCFKTLVNGRDIIQDAAYSRCMLFSVVITAVAALGFVIALSIVLCRLVYERRVNRNLLIAGGTVCVLLATGMLSGNHLIQRLAGTLDEQVQKEAEVIDAIREHANGKLYADVFPEVYRRSLSGFSRSIFSGRELTCYDDITILTDISTDSHVYGDNGFLYLPVSADNAIYTNDPNVIRYFKELGEWLTGYNPCVHTMDVSKQENNRDISFLQYAGAYTMTFDLSVDPGADIDEQEVCTITILPETADGREADHEAAPIVSETIHGSQFDAQGRLQYQIKCNIPSTRRFHILTDGGEAYDLKLNEITYARTPDYDTHYRVNRYGDKLLETYYDLEGNPYQILAGYYGVRNEYDVARQLIRQAYLDENLEPCIVSSKGYAVLCRAYLGDGVIIREEYRDADDHLVALSSGQAFVEYEYDEAGNRTVTRYYNASNEPVLYNGQYWYVNVTYNDQKQNVLEMYYGTDGKPILRPDGAAGYRREYDADGNNICLTYLDAAGVPTTNTSGYTTWRRIYNDKKQIVREAYFDTEDQPVALAAGQAAVEYEYDENGNISVWRFYDTANEPVLYNGQYWYHKVAYNDRKQMVQDWYYGTDGKPILLSDGAAGYKREYDENGNINCLTYLDEAGEPTINVSGYTTWRRIYNDKKQVVRESYYNMNDEPVALAGGYTAVEYEYNEAGEVSGRTYYDIEGLEVVVDE